MKVEKLKNGKYKLINNGIEIETYDEVIVKNNLLYKELTSELKKIIESENEFFDSYFKMVKLISKKLRSESEIRKELKSIELVDQIVEKLKKDNLINDQRFTEAFILDKINFSKIGKSKIKKELLNYEIEEDIIDPILEQFDDALFSANLEKIIKKKISSNGKKSRIALKEKLLYDLSSLGYEKEEILYYFDMMYTNDNDIYNKEREKILKKLSVKYSGFELEKKIREKMYQKGFRE